MQFTTLENFSIPELTDVFNEAFADYAVPNRLTEKTMADKIVWENIQLPYSVGLVDDGKLVAFMCMATDTINGEPYTYNAGTGVIPSHRGQRLVNQMYGYALPILKKQGYHQQLLEVLDSNTKAYKAYDKVGFKTLRTAGCYKGTVKDIAAIEGISFEEIKNPDWQLLQSFWNFRPTWQNSIGVLQRSGDAYQMIGVWMNGELLGYAAFNPVSGRVLQFALRTDVRRQGIGNMLFTYLSNRSEKGILYIINADESDNATIGFFQKIGLEKFVTQYEMSLQF